jgi:threonine dehydrogenase-like Zn-dependent dehydrogenase
MDEQAGPDEGHHQPLMRALVQTAPEKLELMDWPQPQPGPGQVRIRTLTCGICATDLKMLAGWQRTGFPAIPGHEWSGIIEAGGPGVDPGLEGKLCVAENVLLDGGEVGFEHPGGYGEFFLTEARNLYPLPEKVPFTTAVLAEPLAVCLRALHRLDLSRVERTLIFGDGPMGLLMLLLLRQRGVEEVCLVGGVPERLELATELGAAQTLLYQAVGENLAEGIRRVVRSSEFPCIIEASGSDTAISAALELAGQSGQILVIGDYDNARAGFEWNFLLHRELALLGSNAGGGAWPEAVQLLVEGTFPLERLVTHQFPVAEYDRALKLVSQRKDGVVKAVLIW